MKEAAPPLIVIVGILAIMGLACHYSTDEPVTELHASVRVADIPKPPAYEPWVMLSSDDGHWTFADQFGNRHVSEWPTRSEAEWFRYLYRKAHEATEAAKTRKWKEQP